MKQVAELLETGIYESFTPEKSMTVKDLLKELNLAETKCFGVLVNGVKATLEMEISEKDEVVILPKIAGGSLPDQTFFITRLILNNKELSIWRAQRCPCICFKNDSKTVVVYSSIYFYKVTDANWIVAKQKDEKGCFLIVEYNQGGGLLRNIGLNIKIKFLSALKIEEKSEQRSFVKNRRAVIDVKFEGTRLKIARDWRNSCFDCGLTLYDYRVVYHCIDEGFSLDEAIKLLESKFVRFLCCNCHEKRVEKSEANKKCS